MVITLLAKKGGVGKSTVCLLLHEAFKKAGKSVAIQDLDAQGTSTKALSLIDGQRVKPNGEYDIYLYDTPPSLEHQATAAAVRSADIAIVVTSPSPADIWEAAEAVQFVKAKNPEAAVNPGPASPRRRCAPGVLRWRLEGSAPFPSTCGSRRYGN
jgi:chromosome partitioning protein